MVSSAIGFDETEIIITLSNAVENKIPMTPEIEDVVMGMIITNPNFHPPSLVCGEEIVYSNYSGYRGNRGDNY